MALDSMNFNIDHGYVEGLVRGFRSGILRQADYMNLVQCETLEGESNFVLYYCTLKKLVGVIIAWIKSLNIRKADLNMISL